MVAHTRAQDLFGRSEMILLAIKAPEVFDIAFLERFSDSTKRWRPLFPTRSPSTA